ncbi:MAG: type VI secretion system lipoprotein TssJ [Ignavibacteriaceae bacterium]
MKSIPVLFLFFILILTGCGGGPQTINVNLHCDENCNNNNAVVIKIYQLKNAEKFRHANFESLVRNPDELLADDLIPNSKLEKLLVPEETYDFNDLEIKNDASFIAVIGDFHSPSSDGWKQLIPINSDLKNIKVKITENSLSVVIED